MRRSKQTIFILKAKGSKPVKYRAEISWQRTELAVLLCVLGWGRGGGRCWDYSAIWAIRGMGDPKGYSLRSKRFCAVREQRITGR